MEAFIVFFVVIAGSAIFIYAAFKLSIKLEMIEYKRRMDKLTHAIVEAVIAKREEQQKELKEQYDNGDTNIAYDVTPDGAKFYYDIRDRESKQSEGGQ